MMLTDADKLFFYEEYIKALANADYNCLEDLVTNAITLEAALHEGSEQDIEDAITKLTHI